MMMMMMMMMLPFIELNGEEVRVIRTNMDNFDFFNDGCDFFMVLMMPIMKMKRMMTVMEKTGSVGRVTKSVNYLFSVRSISLFYLFIFSHYFTLYIHSLVGG